MPVYFGHPIPTSSKGKKPEASQELKAKGIELLRCSPCDMNIIGIPLALLAIWGIFKEYFSTITYSISIKAGSSLFPEDLEITSVHPDPLPIPLPPICVSLKNHNQASLEFLGNNGFEQVEIRGSTFFLCSTVTRELVRTLMHPGCPAQLEEDSFCPYRFVNISALYSALDIINLLSYACHAMMFTTDDSGDFGRSDYARDSSGDDDAREQMEIEDREAGPTPINKDTAHDIAGLFASSSHSTFPTARVPGSLVDTTVYRKRKFCSTASSFTAELPGTVLRYVPELANEDKTTVLSFIQTFMLWNLGSNMSDCLSSLSQLKSSWGNLCSTDFGLIVSHLAKSLYLAMESQTSITALFDMGFYEGCVLQGEGFRLAVNNIVMFPFVPENLQSDVRGLGTHHNTLQKIIAIIHREQKVELHSKDVISMSSLRTLLLGTSLSESAKEEITALAKLLRYPARPWNINHANIMKMIEIIRGLPVINDSTPLGSRALFSKDMITVALSCFGEGTCPSFIHANGTPIDLSGTLPRPSREQTMGRDKPRGRQTTSNAAWTFAIRRVRYDEALGNLRTLLNNKQARSVSSSIARQLGCVVIQGKQFGEMFGALSDLASISSGTSDVSRPLGESNMGGTADNDDVIQTEGRRVKKVKV
jgi:hypothetical protein